MKFSLPFFRKKKSVVSISEEQHLPIIANPVLEELGSAGPVIEAVEKKTQETALTSNLVDQSSISSEVPAAGVLNTPTSASSELVLNEADIVAAYKIFLGRTPEAIEQVKARVGLPADRLLFDFISCDEFISRKEAANLLILAAQKMVQKHARPATAPEVLGDAPLHSP